MTYLDPEIPLPELNDEQDELELLAELGINNSGGRDHDE